MRQLLMELNEAIDMIEVQLSVVDHPDLEAQREKLVEKRRQVKKALEAIN